ncbi:MAG: DUF2062 domain-containing protein [Halothiobacillaceae bacterium]
MRVFGSRLQDGNLWHLNRRSVSGGVAVGLFSAFVPIPFQMVLAAGLAILARVNLPLSVVLVWITNPVTIGPILWVAYRIGSTILGTPVEAMPADTTLEWITSHLGRLWAPMVTGMLLMALTASLAGFALVRLLWRLNVAAHKRARQASRRLRELRHASSKGSGRKENEGKDTPGNEQPGR